MRIKFIEENFPFNILDYRCSTQYKSGDDTDIDMNELVSEVSSSFRQQISMLEKVVSDQSKSVEELRQFAEKLRKEKQEADEKARKLGISLIIIVIIIIIIIITIS